MTSKYRISVPKAVKDRLWDITFGQDAGQGKCYVCDTIINSKRFEAGHIISVEYGGPTTLNSSKYLVSVFSKVATFIGHPGTRSSTLITSSSFFTLSE